MKGTEWIERLKNIGGRRPLGLALAGVVLLGGAAFWEDFALTRKVSPSPSVSAPTPTPANTVVYYDSYESYLTQKIESFLSQMQGVGQVKALVYVKSSSQSVPAEESVWSDSTTKEVDGEGGQREIASSSGENKVSVIVDADGREQVVILREDYPEIQGIAICAQGASSNVVKEQITQALMALYGLPAHKIEVLGMNKDR